MNFVDVIKSHGTVAQQALLGNDNTDWNNQIYHTAFRYRQQPEHRRTPDKESAYPRIFWATTTKTVS